MEELSRLENEISNLECSLEIDLEYLNTIKKEYDSEMAYLNELKIRYAAALKEND